MNPANSQILPSPPSLIRSLQAGFEAISNHIGLIFFAIGLDILLWLGPRIRLEGLIRDILGWFELRTNMQSPEIGELMQVNEGALLELAGRLNLLNALRTFPVGVPSLMVIRSPIETPIGFPYSLDIPQAYLAVGVWVLLTLVGLFAGMLYFKAVSQAALQGKVEWLRLIEGWRWFYSQVILLALFFIALLVGVSLPLSCILPIALISETAPSSFILLIYGSVLIWLLLPLVFSPHGIFVTRSPMWQSVTQGARLARLTLPYTGLFVLTVIILSQGLDYLWSIPEDDSWITSIGVVGHAFVTTSLLAASFVYYQDASKWFQRITQLAKLTSTKKQDTDQK